MKQPTWRRPGDPQLYRAIAFVWELARRTNPRRFSPGVHKFGSIDEMSRMQEEQATEHVRALAARRRGQ
jgi:hypothetical protein